MAVLESLPVLPERKQIGFIEPGGEELRAKLPRYIAEGLDEFALYGYSPGGFLAAVLTNDLMTAACSADQNSLPAIANICRYVHNFLPGQCHGSREKYNAWLAKAEGAK